MSRLPVRFLFFVLWAAAVLPVPGAAEEPEISVKAGVDKAAITIGEPVTYTVTLRHDPEVQILSEISPPSRDLFEIRKTEPFEEMEGETRVYGKRYTMTAFQLGDYIIEPLKIDYRIGGGEIQSVETSRLYITVESVAKGEPKLDIRSIKSVMDIAREYGWLIALGLLILLAAGAPWIYRMIRARHRETKPEVPPLSPEDEAFVELDRLYDSGLLREDRHKEYFFRLSEILRHYLERRVDIHAVESTTLEIDRFLRDRHIDGAVRTRVREILEAADLAKFAKWKPEAAEISDLHDRSRRIVEAFRPKSPASSTPEVKDGV